MYAFNSPSSYVHKGPCGVPCRFSLYTWLSMHKMFNCGWRCETTSEEENSGLAQGRVRFGCQRQYLGHWAKEISILALMYRCLELLSWITRLFCMLVHRGVNCSSRKLNVSKHIISIIMTLVSSLFMRQLICLSATSGGSHKLNIDINFLCNASLLNSWWILSGIRWIKTWKFQANLLFAQCLQITEQYCKNNCAEIIEENTCTNSASVLEHCKGWSFLPSETSHVEGTGTAFIAMHFSNKTLCLRLLIFLLKCVIYLAHKLRSSPELSKYDWPFLQQSVYPQRRNVHHCSYLLGPTGK